MRSVVALVLAVGLFFLLLGHFAPKPQPRPPHLPTIAELQSARVTRVGGAYGADFLILNPEMFYYGRQVETTLKHYCTKHRAGQCRLYAWGDPSKVQLSLPLTYDPGEGMRAEYRHDEQTGKDCYKLVLNGTIAEQSPGCPPR